MLEIDQQVQAIEDAKAAGRGWGGALRNKGSAPRHPSLYGVLKEKDYDFDDFHDDVRSQLSVLENLEMVLSKLQVMLMRCSSGFSLSWRGGGQAIAIVPMASATAPLFAVQEASFRVWARRALYRRLVVHAKKRQQSLMAGPCQLHYSRGFSMTRAARF